MNEIQDYIANQANFGLDLNGASYYFAANQDSYSVWWQGRRTQIEDVTTIENLCLGLIQQGFTPFSDTEF